MKREFCWRSSITGDVKLEVSPEKKDGVRGNTRHCERVALRLETEVFKVVVF